MTASLYYLIEFQGHSMFRRKINHWKKHRGRSCNEPSPAIRLIFFLVFLQGILGFLVVIIGWFEAFMDIGLNLSAT